MLSTLSDSMNELDKKFGVKELNENKNESGIEEKQSHILFDFISEDICMNLLKYLEKNYQGSSINQLSKVLQIDQDIMDEYIEILLNYGLIIEISLKKEILYALHEGTYYKFIQEIKGKDIFYK